MANFCKKPSKNVYCDVGKIKFEFLVIKFEFDYSAIALKIFLAGFLEKFAFKMKALI